MWTSLDLGVIVIGQDEWFVTKQVENVPVSRQKFSVLQVDELVRVSSLFHLSVTSKTGMT